jgi:hypothetical protein
VQLVGKQADAAAEKRSQPVRLPRREELEAFQPRQHLPPVVYFPGRQSFQEGPLEWQRPQLAGAHHAAIAEAKRSVLETFLDGRLLSRCRQPDRAAAAQLDGDERVRVVRESNRLAETRELDEQRAPFQRDDATDPQLGIESMGEVVTSGPRE